MNERIGGGFCHDSHHHDCRTKSKEGDGCHETLSVNRL